MLQFRAGLMLQPAALESPAVHVRLVSVLCVQICMRKDVCAAVRGLNSSTHTLDKDIQLSSLPGIGNMEAPAGPPPTNPNRPSSPVKSLPPPPVVPTIFVAFKVRSCTGRTTLGASRRPPRWSTCVARMLCAGGAAMNDAAGVVRRANAATAEQILKFAAI